MEKFKRTLNDVASVELTSAKQTIPEHLLNAEH